MKKKIKLFSTIASLCLAVALMAFGVYAAVSHTFSVNSRVSYSVSGQLNLEIEVKVAISNENGIDWVSDGATTGYDGNVVSKAITWTSSITPGQDSTSTSLNLGVFAFNGSAKTGDTITYTVTFKNKATTSATAKLTSEVASSTSGDAITADATTGAIKTKDLAVDITSEGVSYVVTYKLADASKDGSVTFHPSFALAVKAE